VHTFSLVLPNKMTGTAVELHVGRHVQMMTGDACSRVSSPADAVNVAITTAEDDVATCTPRLQVFTSRRHGWWPCTAWAREATWSDYGGGEHDSKTVEFPKHFACDSSVRRGAA
jgi:hypothetical protein